MMEEEEEEEEEVLDEVPKNYNKRISCSSCSMIYVQSFPYTANIISFPQILRG